MFGVKPKQGPFERFERDEKLPDAQRSIYGLFIGSNVNHSGSATTPNAKRQKVVHTLHASNGNKNRIGTTFSRPRFDIFLHRPIVRHVDFVSYRAKLSIEEFQGRYVIGVAKNNQWTDTAKTVPYLQNEISALISDREGIRWNI